MGVGGDQLQPGEEDGGTPTEVVAEENKKIQKETDGRGALGAECPITTPHSRNPLAGVGGDQLQPGVEDGGTPTEVVVEENMKNLKRRKQENPKKTKTRKSKKEGPEYPGEGAAKTSAAGPS